MENEITSCFAKIEQAINDDSIETAESLASELDHRIRNSVEQGQMGEGEMRSLLLTLEGLFAKLQLVRKTKLLEMSKLSKGSAGVKAYKEV